MRIPTKPICAILGGGGHASVLIDSFRCASVEMELVVLDADHDKWGKDILGVPILGGDDLIPELVSEGASHFIVGLGSVKECSARKRLFELGLSHGLRPMTVIHPSAIVSRWSCIGDGSMFFPGCIVNAGATIGDNVIINSGAVVEHDCIVMNHAHIATGARLASTVHVGTGAHVGAGATLLQGVIVGERSVIGAGAVVLREVPADAVVAGVPAKPVTGEKPSAGSQARRE